MEILVQVLASGLTLGAMYAVSTIGLALIYGALNMLNMAQGALLAFGGYVCFYVMQQLGLPAPLAVLAAMLAGGALGLAIYLLVARPMLGSPAFETQIFIATIGIGSGLAAINVRFRDVRQMMPLLIQLWLFATPVAYPASMAPAEWRSWLGINPMAGVVEGYRWAMLNTGPFPFDLVAMSTASALVMLIVGLFVFRRIESSFADII